MSFQIVVLTTMVNELALIIQKNFLKNKTNIMAKSLSLTEQLSLVFSKKLNEQLSNEEISQINDLNTTAEFKESGCCASHQFCDPNELMSEAFQLVFDRENDIFSNTDVNFINNAWYLSKQNKFQIK